MGIFVKSPKITRMKFVKDPKEKREDYIFQTNKKTIFGTKFIIAVLIMLIAAVIVSIFYFEVFYLHCFKRPAL